ncbi:predicted protein [Histoplasma capsulatum H143]|uniref:HIT domain-containing protein n=1 Tax=Ajellomyces capsulatus (strain H143) TaxID=544712 RepID=C6H6N8_AJECH|nr:predicted protein [Histoplasma capsulatum H143]
MSAASAACIFCKIVKGELPCFKLYESERVLAFLDIMPLSRGHAVSYALFAVISSSLDWDYGKAATACTLVANWKTAIGISLHCLVIPKFHGVKLTDIPDEDLTELLPVAKKIAIASGAVDFNILQNNGRPAHQIVDHVHVHMIPKPNEKEGLTIGWPNAEADKEELKKLWEELKSKM